MHIHALAKINFTDFFRNEVLGKVFHLNFQARDEKESEKISAPELVPGPPQKATRKRISPPIDIPQREESRRDHSVNR